MLDLQDESAGLAARGFSQIVVIQIDVVAILQQSIEIVGNNRLTFGVTWQTAGAADEVWDETALRLVGRQYALVDAEQVQPLEIEVAGFEQAHDLQSVRVFAAQFDTGS